MLKARALITGASAGLGRDLAELFAADGHDVVLVARRKPRLESLATELENRYGVTAVPVFADLSDPNTPDELFETLRSRDLAIDFLVNNAGFGSNGPFVELELQRELDMIQVNIAALTHLTKLFVPPMIERGFGRVLNMGSTAGFQGGPYMATYYASKAFVNHFSEALWYELRDTGVTVTVYCPGATATEFAKSAGNDRSSLFKGHVATSEEVARHAYDAMHRGKPIAVHGLRNKLLTQSLRISPRRAALTVTARLNR